MQPLIDNKSIVASKAYGIRACNTSAPGATSPDVGILLDNVGNTNKKKGINMSKLHTGNIGLSSRLSFVYH